MRVKNEKDLEKLADLPNDPVQNGGQPGGAGDGSAGHDDEGGHDKSQPDDTWTTEELEQYILKECSALADIERKSVTKRRRIGLALRILKRRLRGKYRAFLKARNISVTLAHEAVKLAERVEREEDLDGLLITEALVKYGIVNRNPRDEDADQNDADSNESDDDGDRSSPTAEIPLVLRGSGKGDNRKARRQARSKPTRSRSSSPTSDTERGPKDTTNQPVAPEELAAFARFACSVLTEDGRPEAVLSLLEACQDDAERAGYVMEAAIQRIREAYQAGVQALEVAHA